MKTKEENNKLITLFMGNTIYNNTVHFPMLQECEIEELEYHSSWDALMPVVQKCYDDAPYEIVNTSDDGNDIGDITHALLDIDIDGVYRAVIKFIKQEHENYLEEKADSDISVMKDEGLM